MAMGSSVVPLGSVARAQGRWPWCWSWWCAHVWLQLPPWWRGWCWPTMATLTGADVWHEQSRCQACTCVAAGTECRLKYSSAGWWHESRSAAYRYTAPEDPLFQLSPSRIMQLWYHGPQLLELRRHHTPPMESCHAPLHLVPPSIRYRSKHTLRCSHPQWSIFLPVQKVRKQWVLLQMYRHWHSAAELMKSGKHDITKGTQWRPRNWHWRYRVLRTHQIFKFSFPFDQ